MRIILVNHCHPETRHVCAVRAREFAIALSARGHQTVLLTETLSGDEAVREPTRLAADLDAHDWSVPLVVACPPQGHALLRHQRAARIPALLSKPIVAGYYAIAGSVFADWGRGAAPYLSVLAARFRPDVVWATFGNTECLRIGQRIAKLSGCPWVCDIKDYWSTFIPTLVSKRLGRRFADAAAMTTLSHGHVRDIAPFIPGEPTVVYSGIPQALVGATGAKTDPNRIMITGAIYDREKLSVLIEGICAWSDGGTVVEYAGHDGGLVAAAIQGRPQITGYEDLGYVPLETLHHRQSGALANAFIRSGPGWFQHKVPELLSAGRPILSLPGSDPESVGLAKQAKIPFYNCATADDVVQALAHANEDGILQPDLSFVGGFSWARKTEELERVLLSLRP